MASARDVAWCLITPVRVYGVGDLSWVVCISRLCVGKEIGRVILYGRPVGSYVSLVSLRKRWVGVEFMAIFFVQMSLVLWHMGHVRSLSG